MKNKKYRLLLSSLLVLTTFASAQSQESINGNRPSPTERFNQLDINGDGLLSQNEVKGGMAKRFADIDSNSDGQLSPEELQASKPGGGKGGKPGARKAFASMDSDGNGVLSLSEVQASGKIRLIQGFDKIDANNDRELSKEELKALGDKIRERRQEGLKNKTTDSNTITSQKKRSKI